MKNMVLIVSLLLIVNACGDGATSITNNINGQPGQSLSVLFIGNSYSYSNNLPALIANLAEAAGNELRYDSSLIGGYRFSGHSTNSTTLGKISDSNWNAVVLQNQSQVPGWKSVDVTAYSLPYAQTLVNAIQSNNANTKIVYFATWGRRDGDSGNCGYYPLVCTFDGHTTALIEGYNIYVNNAGGAAAAVGAAWRTIVNDSSVPFNTTNLWSGDGSHPQLLGSYVAAAVIYAKLFNESPEGISYTAGLDASDASYIQDIAADTVGIHNAITESGSISCGSINLDCNNNLAEGKTTNIAILSVDCASFSANGKSTADIQAKLSAVATCNSGTCTTTASNTWQLTTGFMNDGQYSVYSSIDMDSSGDLNEGDIEACDDSLANIGSDSNFSITGFTTL